MIKFLINISSFLWVVMLFIFANPHMLDVLDDFVKLLGVFIIICLMNFVLITCIKMIAKKKDKVSLQQIEKSYPAYNEYVPSYFAVCVAAFSMGFFKDIGYFEQIIIVSFLFIIFYMNNIGFINPLLALFGYRIYKLETKNANFILITDKNNQLKNIDKIDNLVKIDEYTLIEAKE